MKLSEFKQALQERKGLHFELPHGGLMPPHFHITEAGLTTKHFIDCGGTVRKVHKVSLQVWTAQDTDHRLTADKLIDIIEKASALFEGKDPEVEVEYQENSITHYGLSQKGANFRLEPLQTDCLAKEKCGVPTTPKKKVKLSDLQAQSACAPGSGCC